MQLRVTKYTGLTVIPGHERYAVELGPILLCAVGGVWNRSIDSMLIRGVPKPLAPGTWLTPPPPQSHRYTSHSSYANAGIDHARGIRVSTGDGSSDASNASSAVSTASQRLSQMDALRFGVVGNPEISFVPYFLVQEEVFEVYPAFE